MKKVYDKIIRDETKLRVKSVDVTDKDDLDYMIKELEVAADFYKDGAYAVAGVQLDIPKRIFIIQNTGDERTIYINPKIIKKDNLFLFDGETCLSFPERKGGDTQRYNSVTLEYYDRDFKKQIEESEKNIKTIVFQHEMDHLNGILYFDRIRKPIIVDNKIGRNDPCVCGSGKKYKKCCLKKVVNE